MRLHPATLQSLARDLTEGRTTSRALVEECLEQIGRADGQGAAAFTFVDAEAARLAADAMDKLRAARAEPSPYAGVPVGTIKRFATGKGNASKDAVLAAMRQRGFQPADDNEADAIAILLWAMETRGGVL